MQPGFELNHLKYFYFTVLEGGVGRAAERLCVQQPVVSKMLRSLEDRFRQPLFSKCGRKKTLTDFGQLVFRHCQTVFREVEALDGIRAGERVLSGPLNLGCAESLAGDALTGALEDLLIEHPAVHPNVYGGPGSYILDLIAMRKLEFGLLFHMPELPLNLEISRRVPLRFHVVVAHGARKKSGVIERFIGSRELDDNRTHRFPTLDRLRRDYPGARIVLSSTILGLHKRLVLSGFGSAVLPRYMVREELKRRQVADLYPRENFRFDLKIITRKSERLSAAAARLLELFILRI